MEKGSEPDHGGEPPSREGEMARERKRGKERKMESVFRNHRAQEMVFTLLKREMAETSGTLRQGSEKTPVTPLDTWRSANVRNSAAFSIKCGKTTALQVTLQ